MNKQRNSRTDKEKPKTAGYTPPRKPKKSPGYVPPKKPKRKTS